MINRVRDAFELLRRTPAGKQALEQHEREITTDREAHVAAIEEAPDVLVNALPKLDDQIARTNTPLDRLRTALKTAEETHRAALLARGNAVWRAGHVRQTHQDELAKGADPRIPGVCTKLRLQYLKEATGGLIVQYEETGMFSAMPSRTPKPQVNIADNSKARLRRMAAMRDAIAAIDALRFDGKADVSDEIQAILEGIPDGTVLEFAYKGFKKELRGQQVIDLYRPIDVAESFSEVLEPAEFVFHDDGGTGGGVDVSTVRPMAI